MKRLSFASLASLASLTSLTRVVIGLCMGRARVR